MRLVLDVLSFPLCSFHRKDAYVFEKPRFHPQLAPTFQHNPSPFHKDVQLLLETLSLSGMRLSCEPFLPADQDFQALDMVSSDYG